MKNQALKTALGSVVVFFVSCYTVLYGQITVTPSYLSQQLAQNLLGNGVSMSNFSYTGAIGSAGFFKVSNSNPSLGIDSGIVLSTGYIKTNQYPGIKGINNTASDGTTGNNRASSNLGTPSDADIATIAPVNFDATILEFDFVPTGDSIVFRYVFASEEYPKYNCTQYNDVFGFFISGPGFTGKKNIALVPNTNIPVAINSINSGIVDPQQGQNGSLPICGSMGAGSPFTQYYVDNSSSQQIAFNGFTKVMIAAAKVQPCQTYHLKLVVADVLDRLYDSGVFLEAKSLKSGGLKISNAGPVNTAGQPYVVEGCMNGSIRVVRQHASDAPQQVLLSYAGTALNGIDVAQLPSSVTIPANDTAVYVPIVPLTDNIAEGIETLKIYISNGCTTSTSYQDSISIQIKDYDTITIQPTPILVSCNRSSVQLSGPQGYTTYNWSPAQQLSSATIANPVATPVADSTLYACEAKKNECVVKSSVLVVIKKLKLVQKKDLECNSVSLGQIKVGTGAAWKAPVMFWINNQAPQTDSTFYNLPAGTYTVNAKDAQGCHDTIIVSIIRNGSSLKIDSAIVTRPTCADTLNGSVAVFVSGGHSPFTFSQDGSTYQNANVLRSVPGSHFVTVKDINSCTDTVRFSVSYDNTVTLALSNDTAICFGKQAQLNAFTNARDVNWSPLNGLSADNIANPVANPGQTTIYTVTARDGQCIQTKQVKLIVNTLPIAYAGRDTSICYNSSYRLNGSGGNIYSWSPNTFLDNTNSARPVTRPQNDMTYQLSVTDRNGCTSATPAQVKIKLLPPVKVDAGRDTMIASGQPLQLVGKQVADSSAKQCVWNPSLGLSNPYIATPVATVTQDQTYKLILRTPQGCEGEALVTIKVFQGPEIYVPTGFTPNGDGKNDVLRPIAVGLKSFKHFNVFNRWGQLVFHSTVPENGWDGKINGVLQSNQSFVWIVEGVGYNDALVQRKGSVVVMP